MDKSKINPHGFVRFHKGYVLDPIRFTKLCVDMLTPADKEVIRAKVKTITSGRAAEFEVGKGDGWTYEKLDLRGRVGVLKRNGVEVALFFERQLTTMEPQPGDVAPEGVLQDPVDTWQRFDLMGPSARKANYFITHQSNKLQEENDLLKQRVENLNSLVADLESRAHRKDATVQSINDRYTRMTEKWMPKGKFVHKVKGFRYIEPPKPKTIKKSAPVKAVKVVKAKGKKP